MVTREVCIQAKTDEAEILRASSTCSHRKSEKHEWFCPWLRTSDTGRALGVSRDRSRLELKDMVSIAETATREVCKQANTDQTEILRAHSPVQSGTEGFACGREMSEF
jgi:hypothetical protein